MRWVVRVLAALVATAVFELFFRWNPPFVFVVILAILTLAKWPAKPAASPKRPTRRGYRNPRFVMPKGFVWNGHPAFAVQLDSYTPEGDPWFDLPDTSGLYADAAAYKGVGQPPRADAGEAYRLAHMAVNDPRMHGTPGVGLDSSGFGERRVNAGQTGERRLAALIKEMGFYQAGWQSWWSLDAGENNGTDVDCVLVHGDDVFLIDAKNYGTPANTSLRLCGNHKTLMVVDADGNVEGQRAKSYAISHNMSMAAGRYAAMLGRYGARIHAVTALCPTTTGTPGVWDRIEYPGNIPLVQAIGYLQHLKATYTGRPEPSDHRMTRQLDALLKH